MRCPVSSLDDGAFLLARMEAARRQTRNISIWSTDRSRHGQSASRPLEGAGQFGRAGDLDYVGPSRVKRCFD